MKRFTLLIAFIILVSSNIFSQKTITGNVTSETDGLGLPGVNILVKGIEGYGTITDYEGNYNIEIPDNATTLIFSFIGMRSEEVEINNRTTINLVMIEESEMLEGVIVTAIGIREEKKSLGYAAQQVTSDELTSSREANMVNSLGSKVAGVEVVSSSGSPGAAANIVIRGRTSLRYDNSPLFVVDGVPIDNSFEGSSKTDRSNRAIDLNSDDIESVTVLKGPAASALYGIRAANGAIIITTKKGQGKGSKTRIEFKSSISFDVVNKLPEKQRMYSQGDNYQIANPNAFSGSSQKFSWGALIDTLRYDGDTEYLYDPNGRMVGMSDPTATNNVVKAYDNPGNFFQTGATYNTHLSMSGGGDVAQYYFSVGRLEQNGIVPNSSFEKTTFKISGETKLSENFKISGSAAYSNTGGSRLQRGSNASGVMFGLMRSPETFDLANGTSDPVNDPYAYTYENDTTQRTWFFDADNPYWSINKNKVIDNVDRIIGYTQFDWSIIPGVALTYRVGIDNYAEEVKDYLANQSKDEYNIGLIINDNKNHKSVNSDLLLTMQRELNEDIELTTILGHNYFSEKDYYTFMQGWNFIIPNFYDISNVRTVEDQSDFLREKKMTGVFYNVKIAYKKFLYLSTTGRNDWSSTLPSGNNSFFYPSVNLGLIFTEPLGLNKNPYFSYGKLRINYAEVGNDAPTYSTSNYFVNTTNVRGQVAYVNNSIIGNSKLEPEKTKSFEVGFDLRFFQNRLGLDMTAYQSRSINQIIDVTIPYSAGYNEMTLNAGTVENKGIELQLFGTPIEQKDFAWDVTLNYSKNVNTVVELSEGLDFLASGNNFGIATTSNVFIPGEAYAVLYGKQWLKDENGKRVIDASGLPIVDTENGIVGDPNPDWIMGIRNTFTYKNISLSSLIDIRMGGDIYNGTVGVMKSIGTHASTVNRTDSVVFSGVTDHDNNPETPMVENTTKTSWYDYYTNYGLVGVSEENIEDGSWIRVKELGISYSLPSNLMDKLPISNINIGFTARNLLLFTNFSGIDPETNLSGATNSLGRDYFNMPNTKTYMFSLKVVL